MEITEVRVFPKTGGDRKLRAFVTITFDHCFVVRDIKVIEGTKGFFVAMPSRKLTKPKASPAGPQEPEGKLREHRDIAHPIKSECRERIEKAVLAAYEKELAKGGSSEGSSSEGSH